MADRSAAFFFDVLAYRASRSVQRMTYAARGMYLEMLCEQWEKGSLPDCPRACADLLGGPVEQWIELWPMLRRNFVDRRGSARDGDPVVHDPGDHDPARQIINLRLERTRRDQRAYFKKKQESGRKGGLVSAEKRRTSSSSTTQRHSSDQIRLDPIRSDTTREEGIGSSESLPRSEPADETPIVLTFPVVGTRGPVWHLRGGQLDGWRGLYPGVDVYAEAQKALAWLQANPGRRKTFAGMPAFLVNWFNRATNASRGPTGAVNPKTAGNPGSLSRFAAKGLQ